jgi:protein-glucosylgalactosylhydroxylysine glucosidase
MKAIPTFAMLIFQCIAAFAQPIDRKALVQRNNVILLSSDRPGGVQICPHTLGNGGFAFTADITGLQTYPEKYSDILPLGTESEWGWHSFPNKEGYRFEESLRNAYAVQWFIPQRKEEASNWFRQNMHRLQLGCIGFEILNKEGKEYILFDLKDVRQEFDLWNGILTTHYVVDGSPVDVVTLVDPSQDILAVSVHSDLLKQNRLKIRIRFPYPTGDFTDRGINWNSPEKHTSTIEGNTIRHQLDSTHYFIETNQKIIQTKPHDFSITSNKNQLTATFRFTPEKSNTPLPTFDNIKRRTADHWNKFWLRGGAVDFSGSADPRAKELERKVIQSQYLMAVQCAGHMPPQETGLTYNSWYGKPHLEMYWWHAVHFALWNRIDLLEKSLQWFATVADKAKAIAERQGYAGVRWQKMTDPQGNESPSSVGAFLIWQQPHYIYMTELVYRHYRNKETLDKYKDLVFATADFMASFARYDSVNERYILGKGVIPAQECFRPETTYNPTFELAYWRWGLSTAQQWRERLGLPRNKKWDDVLEHLSALPQKDGLYLAAESAPDSYTRKSYMTDHPAVLGTMGMLPASPDVDTLVMRNTFDTIVKKWDWSKSWGWDFPLSAMTATRLGLPEQAMSMLFRDEQKNWYLQSGQNYQDQRLNIYLPGNGALLTAIAMMCAGFDGAPEISPGIPRNGKWYVRWENLSPMP